MQLGDVYLKPVLKSPRFVCEQGLMVQILGSIASYSIPKFVSNFNHNLTTMQSQINKNQKKSVI